MNLDEIGNLIGWKWDALHVALALALIGRIYHAATTRGGLIGIGKALLFGTNTPTVPKADGGTVRTYADPPNPPVGDPPPDPPDPGTTSQT